MGFLDRMRGRADAPSSEPASADSAPVGGEADDGLEPVAEIGTRRLTAEEDRVLDAARASYPEHGIDAADLASVSAAYDRALSRAEDHDPGDVVEVLAVALGDYLVAQGGYRWVVSTDPFGEDLAVAPPRRGAPVVTRTLVAVRWMSRESGWLTGVAEHLARAGRA